MKIAIFGSSGLLGSNLCNLYNQHEIKSFSRSYNMKFPDNYIIDYLKIEEELGFYFDDWQPDIIINCIALVNLQECENDISLARVSNCKIAEDLAIISNKYNSYYIHISTDHYYNDSKIVHSETDNVNLLNNYALTKYEAEKEVLKINSKSLVIRTNIVGFRKTNKDSFFEWLLKSLINKEEITLFTNFYTSPISVSLLGEILLKCYNKRINGVYNIAAKEVVSKYDFGLKTAKKFNFDFTNVKRGLLENSESSIKRALTLGLDVSKIEKDLNVDMPTIENTLDSLFKEFLKGKKNEQ